jgi:large subunit ribosomal protein L9
MKVILLENVQGLGNAGDVVDVAEGHARNFLFPRSLAAQATEGRIQEAEKRKTQRAATETIALEDAQKQVSALDGKTLLVRMPAGPDGRLFGSVTSAAITAEIERALGVKLAKGVVRLKEPLKTIGERPVRLEFPHGLEADIIVVVEAVKQDGTPSGEQE